MGGNNGGTTEQDVLWPILRHTSMEGARKTTTTKKQQ
jgi:hypothetical protein